MDDELNDSNEYNSQKNLEDCYRKNSPLTLLKICSKPISHSTDFMENG